MLRLSSDEPLCTAALAAIQTGDVDTLEGLLREHPDLAAASVQRFMRGCAPFELPLIAAAADYPGRFPRVKETIQALVAAGADVNARCAGQHSETALHWAASCDDVEALDALLDAGADIEASGAVIAGGTPLDDAVAFAQWRAARRLVERGARMALWHAAALGRLDAIDEWFASGEPLAPHPWGATHSPRALDVAFWCACHGNQRAAAAELLERGANPRWLSPWDALTPLQAAQRSEATEVVQWLEQVLAAARPS